MNDPLSSLILPGLARRDLKLFEQRQEAEHVAQQRRDDFNGRFMMGAPKLPEAQIVFNAATGRCGVAVRGAPFVCMLPVGYERDIELAVIDGGRFVVTHPNKPALLIDPQRGAVSRH